MSGRAIECDGGPYCKAAEHIEGCFAAWSVHPFRSPYARERDRADRLLEACASAYSQLTDGEGLGPDVSEEAVEAARKTLAEVIVPETKP